MVDVNPFVYNYISKKTYCTQGFENKNETTHYNHRHLYTINKFIKNTYIYNT